MAAMHDPSTPVRVDKWLWAARLVKTRPLAAEAVKGGRVHVNGHAVKPSREVRAGDRVEITSGPARRTVDVKATAERRGSAAAAALLYVETPESREQRERAAAEWRLSAPPSVERGGGRPTKRDRRRLEQARRRG